MAYRRCAARLRLPFLTRVSCAFPRVLNKPERRCRLWLQRQGCGSESSRAASTRDADLGEGKTGGHHSGRSGGIDGSHRFERGSVRIVGSEVESYRLPVHSPVLCGQRQLGEAFQSGDATRSAYQKNSIARASDIVCAVVFPILPA
jgi:hypothetical protein